MIFDPERHHRRSQRWTGYDYSQAGVYFITIRSFGGRCVFGRVVEAAEGEREMRLNRFGRLVAEQWLQTPLVRPGVELDEWQVMPNHFHALVWLPAPSVHTNLEGVEKLLPTVSEPARARRSLSSLEAGFAGAVTSAISGARGDKTQVWQRNFHDRVVRSQRELENIRTYIRTNPQRWQMEH